MYDFNTDQIEYDKAGLPVGINKFMAVKEEVGETKKPENPSPVIITWECVEGEHKGKQGKVWYNLNHSDKTTANIARQSIKRIADATGKPVSSATPIKGRVCFLDVREQKKDPRYTEVNRYLPADHKPEAIAPF